ncbi:ATP-binding protein [Alkalihalobacterium bogoriense]|uniref:ATP-binding protein n=1 Tax=Alkalihalobacterium bogoriense TaxID=246272 RepID=UPI00047CD171|nr:ATP-binding protein [Alkalihalobacterium bogoriense]
MVINFTLPCSLQSISYLDEVVPFVIEQSGEVTQHRFYFALHEILINSYESVQSQYGDKTERNSLIVSIELNQEEVIGTVTDNGGGDIEHCQAIVNEKQIDETLFEDRGRGLLLVRELVDDVSFQKGNGNDVITTIRKRRT